MKLAQKSLAVFSYVKENGGRITLNEVVDALGTSSRSVSANLNDLVKKGLAIREKVAVEGMEKPVTYITLTPEGKEFVQPEGDE